MNDPDSISSRLRTAERTLGDPPADLAARCLRRIRQDRRRRRWLRGGVTAIAFAAAAGLAVALMLPSVRLPVPVPAPVAATPSAPGPAAPILPVSTSDTSLPPSADLRRILTRTTYGSEREAIIQDLRGCRTFLLACVPGVNLSGERPPRAEEHPDGL